MKRDFLLGGTKLPTGGAVRGAGGAMSPPVFMLKEALQACVITLIWLTRLNLGFRVSGEFYKHGGRYRDDETSLHLSAG